MSALRTGNPYRSLQVPSVGFRIPRTKSTLHKGTEGMPDTNSKEFKDAMEQICNGLIRDSTVGRIDCGLQMGKMFGGDGNSHRISGEINVFHGRRTLYLCEKYVFFVDFA